MPWVRSQLLPGRCRLTQQTEGLRGNREPVWEATMLRFLQTVRDFFGVLMQLGGSPFDCSGRGSTDQNRMACKRPGVRVPLAPPRSENNFDRLNEPAKQ